MSLRMVVGGQFGSEGKGKVINSLIDNIKGDMPYFVVRCGGANSGHTTRTKDGRETIVKQLPSAVHDDRAVLMIAAGCLINKSVLLKEIADHNIPISRLVIDPMAMVICDDDRAKEASDIVSRIGSTGSGTGAAMARRIMRDEDVKLAEFDPELNEKAIISRVGLQLAGIRRAGAEVIVEGTQGYGLSILHGLKYPYLTARDTTAPGFASEVGIAPSFVDEVILTIRACPIRVGGNSGPLSGETTWEAIKDKSNAPDVELEYTSVTNRLRRVGEFDIDLVRNACFINGPKFIALMGVDRLNYANRGVKDPTDLTSDVLEMCHMITQHTGVNVGWIGTGPRIDDIIDMRLPQER